MNNIYFNALKDINSSELGNTPLSLQDLANLRLVSKTFKKVIDSTNIYPKKGPQKIEYHVQELTNKINSNSNDKNKLTEKRNLLNAMVKIKSFLKTTSTTPIPNLSKQVSLFTLGSFYYVEKKLNISRFDEKTAKTLSINLPKVISNYPNKTELLTMQMKSIFAGITDYEKMQTISLENKSPEKLTNEDLPEKVMKGMYEDTPFIAMRSSWPCHNKKKPTLITLNTDTITSYEGEKEVAETYTYVAVENFRALIGGSCYERFDEIVDNDGIVNRECLKHLRLAAFPSSHLIKKSKLVEEKILNFSERDLEQETTLNTAQVLQEVYNIVFYPDLYDRPSN